MRNYFCYSSALDQASLDQWKNQHGYSAFQLPTGVVACADNVKLVCDFPSRFWGGRVLSLTSETGAKVWGVLFKIESDADWSIVGHKEGKMTGVSVEETVRVTLGDQVVEAVAFVTHPSRRSAEGPVSKNFISALSRAYQFWKLPTSALEELSL